MNILYISKTKHKLRFRERSRGGFDKQVESARTKYWRDMLQINKIQRLFVFRDYSQNAMDYYFQSLSVVNYTMTSTNMWNISHTFSCFALCRLTRRSFESPGVIVVERPDPKSSPAGGRVSRRREFGLCITLRKRGNEVIHTPCTSIGAT